MAKVAFFGLPAHGHTNPSLPVVRELVRHGESVTYYSHETFRGAIESTGARFRAYDPPLGKNATPEAANSLLLIALLLETTLEMLPRLVEDLKRDPVDYAIHDSVCPWGRCASEVLGLPSVCSTTTFALAPGLFRADHFFARFWTGVTTIVENLPYLGRIGKAQKKLARNYGIKIGHVMNVVSNPAPLTIVYTSRELQPRAELFGSNYLFVGPSIADREPDPEFAREMGNGPVIYISLGTIFNEQTEFYRVCMEALGGMKQRVVLSVGRKTDIASLGPLPGNFLVRNWAPQLEVLSRAGLFLTRAGVNSVHEALLYGVPMLLFPQIAEQKMVAKQIAKLGAGVVLSERVKPRELREQVERVLGTASFRQAAEKLSFSLRNSGGHERAAEAILEYRAGGGRTAGATDRGTTAP
ncbi:MAG TPA: macrolide family glycosyltransferase [Bryobacteraceae bacterium]|jgi:MGT family glycosyltransferase